MKIRLSAEGPGPTLVWRSVGDQPNGIVSLQSNIDGGLHFVVNGSIDPLTMAAVEQCTEEEAQVRDLPEISIEEFVDALDGQEALGAAWAFIGQYARTEAQVRSSCPCRLESLVTSIQGLVRLRDAVKDRLWIDFGVDIDVEHHG